MCWNKDSRLISGRAPAAPVFVPKIFYNRVWGSWKAERSLIPVFPPPPARQGRGPYGVRWGPRLQGLKLDRLFFPSVRLRFSCDLSQTALFLWLSTAPLRQGLGPCAGFFFVLVGGGEKKWSHRGLSFGAVWTAALSGLGLCLSFPCSATPSLK